MKNKLFGYICCALLIINGLFIVVLPKPTIRRYILSEYETDLTGAKWLVGPLLIGMGFWYLYKTYYGKFNSFMVNSYYKCISCGNVFEVKGEPEFPCNRCGGRLVPLEGFFEKYPEFKDKDEMNSN